MLLCNALYLSSLGVDCLGGVLDVVVDKLLVGGVDERDKECDTGSDNSETPVRHKLDKEVRNESSSACLDWKHIVSF